MALEIPDLKKCCCCLPLRGGLLGWAYFKLVANAIIILVLAYFILTSLLLSLYADKSHIPMVLLYVGMILLIFLLFLTDFVATIVFIVAAHKKKASVIRGYFVYNIGVLIVMLLLIIGAFGIAVTRWVSDDVTKNMVVFAGYVLTLVVQVYFTLLVRSAAVELESSGEFRFVNNSGEAQCMMINNQKETEAGAV